MYCDTCRSIIDWVHRCSPIINTQSVKNFADYAINKAGDDVNRAILDKILYWTFIYPKRDGNPRTTTDNQTPNR